MTPEFFTYTKKHLLFSIIGWLLLLATGMICWLENTTGFLTSLRLPPCLFHLATGYYCPGCGGTRAAIALLHGEFIPSFLYHPAVLYGAVLFFRVLLGSSLELVTKEKLPWGYGMKKRDVICLLFLTALHFVFINGSKALFDIDFFQWL